MKNLLIIILLFFSSNLFAQTKIDSLENLLQKDSKNISLLNELAYKYWNVSPDKGLNYADKAYSFALKENNKTGIAKALQNKGICYWAKSELQLALKNHQKSLEIYEEIKNINGISSSFCNIGIVFDDLSDYKNALKYYLKSIKISEENGFTDLYIKTIGNISSIYLEQQNYSKAQEYIEEAIHLSKKQGDNSNTATHLNTMGAIYESQNNYKKAKTTYKKAHQLFKENKNIFGTAVALYNIGETEYHLKNYANAITYYNESLILSEKINDLIGVLLAYKSIGIIHKEQNHYNTALAYYKKSLNLANKLDSKDEKLELYNKYAELYKSTGKLDMSIIYLRKFILLKDSIYNESNSKQIAEMQTKYESEKKEKENELLRKNNKIQNLEITKQTNIRNSFIGISILIILIISILLNRFASKKKTNKLLILKNKVISNQRDELKKVNATKDKFLSIISHDLRSPFNSLLGITDLLVNDYNKIDDTQKKNLLTSLNTASQSTYELLENLLSWARAQRGKIEINKELLNLKKLIDASIAPYKYNASKKNIKIITNVPLNTICSIDRNTSMTFIGNLVNNAIKFTHEGGTITINYQQNKENVELHIIDTGVGMTPELIHKLFRIDIVNSSRGTNNEKGSALGLILCKEFIKLNGGNISVISEVEKGSKFIISLPI